MYDITEKVCKWKRLVLHFWSWNSAAAHGPFVRAGLSGASAHKRKCLWSYSNRRIKSAVWWLGWHICLAVMKISPLMAHSVIGPEQPPPPQPHILSLYPSYKWQTDSGSGDIAAASGRAGAQCLCACVQTCQPVTLHILLMCMTELSPLAAPTS